MPAEFSLADVDATYPGFDEKLRTALRPPS
jgi:hypothetical protein